MEIYEIILSLLGLPWRLAEEVFLINYNGVLISVADIILGSVVIIAISSVMIKGFGGNKNNE